MKNVVAAVVLGGTALGLSAYAQTIHDTTTAAEPVHSAAYWRGHQFASTRLPLLSPPATVAQIEDSCRILASVSEEGTAEDRLNFMQGCTDARLEVQVQNGGR